MITIFGDYIILAGHRRLETTFLYQVFLPQYSLG